MSTSTRVARECINPGLAWARKSAEKPRPSRGVRSCCAARRAGYTGFMQNQILYVGDTALREAAGYLAGVMHHFDIGFDYVPSEGSFPLLEGSAYRGVILSDYPSKNFAAGQLEDLAVRVRGG